MKEEEVEKEMMIRGKYEKKEISGERVVLKEK
jgi:hypothetical protein